MVTYIHVVLRPNGAFIVQFVWKCEAAPASPLFRVAMLSYGRIRLQLLARCLCENIRSGVGCNNVLFSVVLSSVFAELTLITVFRSTCRDFVCKTTKPQPYQGTAILSI